MRSASRSAASATTRAQAAARARVMAAKSGRRGVDGTACFLPPGGTRLGLLLFELRADDVARDDDLDAPVLLAALGAVVRCDRPRLAEALGRHAVDRNTLVDEVVAHRRRAVLRKLQVVLVAPRRVRVPLDVEPQAG